MASLRGVGSEQWGVASAISGKLCVFRGIVPLQWEVRNGEWEQWGVRAVGSQSGTSGEWDQWEAGAESVGSGKPE